MAQPYAIQPWLPSCLDQKRAEQRQQTAAGWVRNPAKGHGGRRGSSGPNPPAVTQSTRREQFGKRHCQSVSTTSWRPPREEPGACQQAPQSGPTRACCRDPARGHLAPSQTTSSSTLSTMRRKRRVRSCVGSSSTDAGGPCSTITPSSMNRMRSATSRAKRTS